MRYEAAVGYSFLRDPKDLSDLDIVLCEHIEMEWAKWILLYAIADGLSGLHFFWPELQELLRNSWRMLKNWRVLTPLPVRAMIARAVQLQDLAFACMLAVGFHGL